MIFSSSECQLFKFSEYDKNLFNFNFFALGRLLQYFFLGRFLAKFHQSKKPCLWSFNFSFRTRMQKVNIQTWMWEIFFAGSNTEHCWGCSYYICTCKNRWSIPCVPCSTRTPLKRLRPTFRSKGSCEFWTTNFRIMWPSSETRLQVQGIVCIVMHKLLFLCNFILNFCNFLDSHLLQIQ